MNIKYLTKNNMTQWAHANASGLVRAISMYDIREAGFTYRVWLVDVLFEEVRSSVAHYPLEFHVGCLILLENRMIELGIKTEDQRFYVPL